MENGHYTWIANFIWGIADDVLRDVILHMTELRHLDATLERTKLAVLDMKASRDKVSCIGQFWGVADKLPNFKYVAPKADLIGATNLKRASHG